MNKLNGFLKFALIIISGLSTGLLIDKFCTSAQSATIATYEMYIILICSLLFMGELIYRTFRKRDKKQPVQISKIGGAAFLLANFLVASLFIRANNILLPSTNFQALLKDGTYQSSDYNYSDELTMENNGVQLAFKCFGDQCQLTFRSFIASYSPDGTPITNRSCSHDANNSKFMIVKSKEGIIPFAYVVNNEEENQVSRLGVSSEGEGKLRIIKIDADPVSKSTVAKELGALAEITCDSEAFNSLSDESEESLLILKETN